MLLNMEVVNQSQSGIAGAWTVHEQTSRRAMLD
jgi:hypothetical protein